MTGGKPHRTRRFKSSCKMSTWIKARASGDNFTMTSRRVHKQTSSVFMTCLLIQPWFRSKHIVAAAAAVLPGPASPDQTF